MSRSRRRTPIIGMANANSEKQDKRAANSRHRCAVRAALRSDAEIIPLLREVSDVWLFAKDGKQWWPAGQRRK